jgi:23S rRNA-/tRNA-specific pseudouridylate synthase
MRARFAARQVIKTYLALVTGEVTAPGRLEHLLAHKPSAPGVMVDARQLRAPPARPMRAVTGYRPLRRVGEGTLLEVDILTGVTHQIRCQLALAGHPILGDSRYGGPAREGFARHFLHATRLAFAHPLDDAPTVIEAPLPRELAALLD